MEIPNHLMLAWVLSSFFIVDATAEEARITSGNAHQMRAVVETAKKADRLILGPQPGEVTIFGISMPLKILDDKRFQTLRNINDGFMPTDFVWSPDGKLLAWTQRPSQSYFVVEAMSGKTIEIDIGDFPGQAAFSPDSKLLAIGKTHWIIGGPKRGRSDMLIFDVSGKQIHSLGMFEQGELRPVFSPEGKILAVNNLNHETRLFDVETGKLLFMLLERHPRDLAFSPDGKTLAVGYRDGRIALWDVSKGWLQRSMAPSGCKQVYSVAFNPTGDVLATSGQEGKIILWDASTLEKLATLDASKWVFQVLFTADGKRLLASCMAAPPDPLHRIITYAISREE